MPSAASSPMEVAKIVALLGHELHHARPDRVQLLGGRPAVGGQRLRAAQLLAPQARHPHLEELVEVVDEEEQGADAVEQRIALVTAPRGARAR